METQTTITEGDSSSPVAEGGLFDTMNLQPQAVETPEITEAPEDVQDVETKTAETPDGEAVKEDRFDQNPRWQEIMAARDANLERALRAEARLEAQQVPQEPQAPELDFKDLSAMSKEDVQEWMDDDPIGFNANLLKQAKHELRTEILNEVRNETSEQQQENAVRGTYGSYAEKNPDFMEKWNNGKIQQFMETNPGHNAMSAHMAMTMETRIEQAKADAAKEAEARVLKNMKAKGNARSLEAGPSGQGGKTNAIPDELINPEKYGGTDSVLLDRHMRRLKGEKV